MKHISKSLLMSLFSLKLSYNKLLFDFLIIDLIIDSFRFFITKYIEKDLQKILKKILKAYIFFSNRLCKKLLKVRLSDIYYNKSHIEYYNFCQQYEDYFTIAKTKGLNHIFL